MDTHGHNHSSPAPLPAAAKKAWGRKWSFLAIFLWVLFVSIGMLGALDLLPEKREAEAVALGESTPADSTLSRERPEEPTKIEIPELGIEQPVLNPMSTDIVTLDKALMAGTVRYPSSSNLGETGNVIIFGHSSYLPIVRNQAFKAFNGIQNLDQGDRILVTGTDRVFVYEVEKVVTANADSDAIPLSAAGSQLTLVSCDSFGSKADRFVLTANLVESYPIGK